MRIKVLVLMLAALAGSGGALAQRHQALDIDVVEAPKLVRVGETEQLVYELHLTNFSSRPLRLGELIVKADVPIKTYAGDELASAMAIVGPSDAKDAGAIGPGRRAILYVNVPVTAGLAKGQIIHELKLTEVAADGGGAVFTVTGGQAGIEADTLPRLSPPLRGGPWVAVYAPSMERGHRRVFYATEGSATLPGRFAVDWMKVDAEGKLSSGDADIPANHYGYGEEVLAVADGIIVAVRDDVPDPATRSSAPKPTVADASGNFVTLDIGGGRYAIYEHLKQGSPVAVGDHVKAGQTIGYLGFTGQASAPHLHFHLADRPSILGAEGQPYVLSSFTRLGQYASIDAFGRREKWPADRPEILRDSFLPPNLVVRFASD